MIKELDNQELDNFISKQNYSQFLQSSLWGKFQKSLGNRIWQIGVDEGGLEASALVIEKKLPFNLTYLYIPRGPIVADQAIDKDKLVKLLLKGVRDISIQTAKRQEIFFRFETLDKFDLENVLSVESIQPADTLLLDLNKLEKELLTEMHQKTRYNIRLAKKKGVEIEKIEDKSEAMNIFNKLIKETSARDKFIPHTDRYYQKMLEALNKNVRLWVAKYEDKVLAANIIVNFGDTVTYLHGASSNEHRNLMAPHLLQWEQIKWAKSQGYKIYDFWGISDSEPSWIGFTKFKKGFGGYEKNFPGTFDLVYNQRIYKLYNFLKKFI
jgi:peptidoglycan pentaglycine glycine transferase (the first glycine)